MARRIKPSIIIINVIAWTIGLIWALPIIGLVMVSIRPYSEVIVRGWWNIVGASFTIDNYAEALFNPFYDMYRGFENSLIVAVTSTIVPIFLAALTAYAFSRFSFPIKSYLFLSILLLMNMPQQVIVVPLFKLLIELGLFNTLQGLILVHSSWGLAWIIFLLKNYFDMLPRNVEEAARVDGATDFQIFSKIVFPLALPALASAAAIQFTWVWSDFFLALIFIASPERQVITQKLAFLKGEYHVDWGLLAAGSIITMSVPLILYAVLQKQFVRGLVGWTVRG